MCSTTHSPPFKRDKILEACSQLTRKRDFGNPPKSSGGRSACFNHQVSLQTRGRGPGPPWQLVGRWWFSWRLLPGHKELLGSRWVEGKEHGPGMEEDPAAGTRQGGGPGLATAQPMAWQEHILHLRAKDPSTGSRLHPSDQGWELRSQD